MVDDEELVWTARAPCVPMRPRPYKIPACSDRPDVFNVSLWDGANREETVYRSKAVGEPPFMLGISVLMALSDACAACGPHYPGPAGARDGGGGSDRRRQGRGP